MPTNDNFYENLGTYYSKSSEISEKINSKIFNDYKLTIKIIVLDQTELQTYKIERIDIPTNKKSRLDEKIQQINSSLENRLDFKCETKAWSLFYLIKEMVTLFEQKGYNYYRGQNKDWETVPGIFRQLENSDGSKFYNEFESLYLNISREFPDNIKYIPLTPETIDERADELSILQHYGLPTSLLDISENPFIAMLFMIGFGKIKKPQLEFYKINNEEDIENSLISFVHKKISNKRIQAQEGAFINFDKLIKFIDFQKNEIKLKSYKPIDRIILKIDIDELESKRQLEEQKETTLNDNDQNTKNLSNANLDVTMKSLESIIESCYDFIQKELLIKLKEFHYEVSKLFPDFSDYLNYKSKEFKQKEASDNENSKLTKLKPSSTNS